MNKTGVEKIEFRFQERRLTYTLQELDSVVELSNMVNNVEVKMTLRRGLCVREGPKGFSPEWQLTSFDVGTKL